MRLGGRLIGAYVALVLAFLMAPVVVIVLFSFNQGQNLSFPIKGLSLRWYEHAAANATLVTALQNSLIVAVGALVTIVVVATPAAWYLARSTSRARGLLMAATVAPLALPGLFIGIALLTYFGRLGLEPSLTTVTIAHVLYTMGFYVLIASRRFAALDPAFEEAARTLGASRAQSMRLIVWPAVRPALIAALALCLALSLDEFIISFFVIGPENTLPIVIFSNIRTTVTPQINAVATFLLLVSWISVGLAAWMARDRAARRRTATTPEVTT
jgi:ABC-type spermidine/putrescine transport system permease subunit II